MIARRVLVTALVLALVGLGFAKLANDELRHSTRAAHKTLTAQRVIRRATVLEGRGPGGPPAVVEPFTTVAPRPPLPRPASSLTPASRPMGADALGTSLPKRLRWLALGGHGRNGAG